MAFRLLPSRTALNTLFCRRNKSRRNFFQGNVFQDSLVLLLCLIILFDLECFLNTLQQLRCILPESKEFRCSSSLRKGSTPLRPLIRFYSFPWLDCYVPLGVATSTTGFPRLLPLVLSCCGGNSLQSSQGFYCCALLPYRLLF